MSNAHKTMKDPEDPSANEDYGKLEKKLKKSLPPGPEIVLDDATPGAFFSSAGNRMTIPKTPVAEVVEITVEKGTNKDDNDLNDNPNIATIPWYQNTGMVSFISFVLLLIAGVAVGIPLTKKDSKYRDPSHYPTPSDLPSIAEIKQPTLYPTSHPTPHPTPHPTVPLPRCNNDGDCTSTTCAYESYIPTSQKVCCASDSIRIYRSSDSTFPKDGSSAYFCTGQPSGSRCPNNNICASGVCVQKTCRDGLQGTDEVCDNNNDCASRVCVNNVCKAGLLGPSSPCDDKNDCTSASCAFGSYTTTSQKVCCANDSLELFKRNDSAFPKDGSSAYFCKDQPSGSRCPNNNICASGVCVQKTCRDGLQETDEVCDNNNDCASGVCVNNVCKSGLLGPSSPCDDKNDCTSASCAFGSYTTTSQKVCCASESLLVNTLQDSAFPKPGLSAYFCKDQPSGSRCPNNNICASGVCVRKICRDGLQGTDEVCDNNNDCASRVCVNNVCKSGLMGPSSPCDDKNDCTSASCAFGSYTTTSQKVCCASGSLLVTVFQDSAFPKPGLGEYFCKDQPSGSRCPLNSLCTSGVCVRKTCRDSRQGTGEECDDKNDCASRVCVNNVCQA